MSGVDKVRAVNLGGWLVIEGWIKTSLFDGIPNGDMLVSGFLFGNCTFIFQCFLDQLCFSDEEHAWDS